MLFKYQPDDRSRIANSPASRGAWCLLRTHKKYLYITSAMRHMALPKYIDPLHAVVALIEVYSLDFDARTFWCRDDFNAFRPTAWARAKIAVPTGVYITLINGGWCQKRIFAFVN